MGKILVVCACLSVAAWADPAASQPIETNSFRYVPPAGWVVNLTTRPVSIVGPRSVLLATLDASGNAQTAISAIRQSFEAIRWTQ